MKTEEENKSREVLGLEKTLQAVRTQIKLQERLAIELAEAVNAAFLESGGIEGVMVINASAALRACKLADDVLA